MLSDDRKLHILNENTVLIRQFNVKSRLITHSYFLDSEDALIIGGVEGAMVYQLDYAAHYEPKYMA